MHLRVQYLTNNSFDTLPIHRYFKLLRDENDPVSSCQVTQYVDTALPAIQGKTYNKTIEDDTTGSDGLNSGFVPTASVHVFLAAASVGALFGVF